MVDIAQVHATLVAGDVAGACVEHVRSAECTYGRRSIPSSVRSPV
jgi:hypothetical protein